MVPIFSPLSTALILGLCVLCTRTVVAQHPGVEALPRVVEFEHVAMHPHDPGAFTQGLFYRDGFLYESTGLYGKSSLRKVDIATGRVERRIDIPKPIFAEGCDQVGHYVYLLSWKEKTCFVLDRETFKEAARFPYAGEGWGLCFDGKSLILSDGTATLRFMDPKTFKQTAMVTVFDGPNAKRGKPVANLNELEYVHGEVWANVYCDTRVARINPTTGRVIGWIDFSALVPEAFRVPAYRHGENVLNGIAYHAETGHVYVTGKNWPVLHELKIKSPDTK